MAERFYFLDEKENNRKCIIEITFANDIVKFICQREIGWTSEICEWFEAFSHHLIMGSPTDIKKRCQNIQDLKIEEDWFTQSAM